MSKIFKILSIIWLALGICISSYFFSIEYKTSNKTHTKGGRSYKHYSDTNIVTYTNKDYSNTILFGGITVAGFALFYGLGSIINKK